MSISAGTTTLRAILLGTVFAASWAHAAPPPTPSNQPINALQRPDLIVSEFKLIGSGSCAGGRIYDTPKFRVGIKNIGIGAAQATSAQPIRFSVLDQHPGSPFGLNATIWESIPAGATTTRDVNLLYTGDEPAAQAHLNSTPRHPTKVRIYSPGTVPESNTGNNESVILEFGRFRDCPVPHK